VYSRLLCSTSEWGSLPLFCPDERVVSGVPTLTVYFFVSGERTKQKYPRGQKDKTTKLSEDLYGILSDLLSFHGWCVVFHQWNYV